MLGISLIAITADLHSALGESTPPFLTKNTGWQSRPNHMTTTGLVKIWFLFININIDIIYQQNAIGWPPTESARVSWQGRHIFFCISHSNSKFKPEKTVRTVNISFVHNWQKQPRGNVSVECLASLFSNIFKFLRPWMNNGLIVPYLVPKNSRNYGLKGDNRLQKLIMTLVFFGCA